MHGAPETGKAVGDDIVQTTTERAHESACGKKILRSKGRAGSSPALGTWASSSIGKSKRLIIARFSVQTRGGLPYEYKARCKSN